VDEAAMHKILDAFAKAGKQLGVGESVGRIWGFLLLQSGPVTQKEIQAGTGLSRGLISQCLRGMEERTVATVDRSGRENRYSINPSVATCCGELVGRHYEERVKRVIAFLSEVSATLKDTQVRESVRSIISEYEKVSIAFLLFPQLIALINESNLELQDVKGVVKSIYLRIEKEKHEDVV
jgi:DNA-binding transcriptional regulator GbsR (MarR family)